MTEARFPGGFTGLRRRAAAEVLRGGDKRHGGRRGPHEGGMREC